MDKLIIVAITLFTVSVLSIGASTLHDINDGRIETVVNQLTKGELK